MDANLDLIGTREKTVNVRVEVFALDEFYSATAKAGRSDLAARRKIGGLNDTQDLEGTLRKLAPGAGAYYVAAFAGRDVVDSDVFHVQPKGQKLEIESSRGQTTTAAQPAAPLAPFAASAPVEQSSAQSINATTETIRATKELLREVQPAPLAAPSPADIQKMIADGVREGLAQQQSTQTAAPPLDPFAFMERSLSLQEQMRQAALASNPPVTTPASPVDPAEQFEKQLETYKRLSEIVNPISERDDRERGIFDKILGAIEGVGKAAPALLPLIKPMMPARIQALMAGADASDAAPPEQTQPQATAAQAQPTVAAPATPKDETEAFQLILHVAVADLIRNKRIGRVADLVEEMCRRFPTLNATMDQLCSLTPESALATLESYAQRTDLASLSHSIEWVMNLQDELRPDDEGGDPDGGETQPGDAPNIVQMASVRAQ